MDRLRHAAAVILTRGEGQALEVFLVERSPSLRFFGGYWAFPGGVVDPVDEEGGGGASADGFPSERALLRCGERELFEEVGVLTAARELEAEARSRLRVALEAGEARGEWRALRATADELERCLRPVCRVTTPPFAPVRYRTLFAHLALECGEEPRVVPGELVRGRFWRPADAHAAWLAGELAIVPPVLFLVELLARRGSFEAFVREAGRVGAEIEAGRLHEVRHTPGVFTAPLRTPTVPPATTTNTYLVGEERVYVVDPATPEPSEQERLFALLDGFRAEGRELAGIVLTHHHPDHVGAVGATSRRYDLAVHAHPLTLERIPRDFEQGRALGDGDELPLGNAPDGRPDWTLAAVFTPGHDRGHLAFLESRYRALIAGDAVSTLSTIVIDPPEGHLATYLASLRRLRDLGVRTVYPAHGPAHPDGPRLFARYLDHRAERERALVAALADGLATVEELLPVVYADTDPALHGLAERSLEAGLLKLAEEGRVARAGDRWIGRADAT